MKLSVTSAAVMVSASGSLDVTGPMGYSKHFTGSIPLNFSDDPVRVGTYSFAFSATGTGGAAFEAHGNFVVTAGAVTNVSILAQQTDATKSVLAMFAPFTKSITYTLPGPDTGGWKVPIDLTASVTLADNDNPDLDFFVFTWKHSCNGSPATLLGFFLPLDIVVQDDKHIKDTAVIKTTFLSECQGTEVITFDTINTNMSICQNCSLESNVSISIPYDPQGYAGRALVNFAPVATCHLVTNAEPCAGGAVYADFNTYDPDSSNLALTWTSACPDQSGGPVMVDSVRFSDQHSAKTSYTVPPGVTPGTQCALILSMDDGNGGVNTAAVFFKTAPAAFCSAVTPGAVSLGSAGTFTILSKTGITDVPTSRVIGNVGTSPISGTAMLLTCNEVVGNIYTVDAAGPLPCVKNNNATLLTAAIGDMELAYGNAAGRAANTTELNSGNIGGLTLVPGVYKWTTAVTIPTDVTLNGGASDVWVFQISKNLTLSPAKKVILTGGALAKNVSWQVAEGATLGAASHFEGTILSKTLIAVETGATVTGRLFAQTAVTLDKATVNRP